MGGYNFAVTILKIILDLAHLHDDSVEISAAEKPRQADVGDVGAGEHDALEPGAVQAHNGGNVVIALQPNSNDL